MLGALGSGVGAGLASELRTKEKEALSHSSGDEQRSLKPRGLDSVLAELGVGNKGNRSIVLSRLLSLYGDKEVTMSFFSLLATRRQGKCQEERVGYQG